MNLMSINKKVPIKVIWMDKEAGYAKPMQYLIKYSLRTELQEDMTHDEGFIQQNIAFQTANEFLYSQLYQSIVYDKETKKDVENCFSSYNNNFCFLPVLSEATFLSCIHSKLNSIIPQSSIIDAVELVDESDEISYSFFTDDLDYYTLPNMDDWLGPLSFWKTPWWARKDFSTFDNYALDQKEYDDFTTKTDITELSEKMKIPIEEIEEEVRLALTKDTKEKSSGHLIEVDFKTGTKFKPKLVPKPKK